MRPYCWVGKGVFYLFMFATLHFVTLAMTTCIELNPTNPFPPTPGYVESGVRKELCVFMLKPTKKDT